MNLPINQIILTNCLKGLRALPSNSVHCCVTSPPYWGLRDYRLEPTEWPECSFVMFGFTITVPAWTGCLGLEPTPEMFIAHMVLIFEEVRRVLRPEGTCWVNMGDSYCSTAPGSYSAPLKQTGILKGVKDETSAARMVNRPETPSGCKPKDLIGIPWMLAFALRSAGWYLRSDIIWNKPNPMPESVTDRPTKAHEYIFLFSKSRKYYYDAEAIKVDASESFKNDSRHQTGSNDNNIKNGYEAHGAQNPKGPHRLFKHKNLEEKGQKEHSFHRTRFEEGTLPIAAKANKRSVWTVTTQAMPEAHFATFPQRLIDDCIKAGTSEKGCCSECGEPLEREMIEVGRAKLKNGHQNKPKHIIVEQRGESSLKTSMHTTNSVPVKETTGWKPTCKCEATVKPCIVLDIFMGAGTTALVARKLNRNFIGFELNPAYIKIAEKRLKKELGMFYEPINAL